jgi:DNA polymerase-3 subunit beta
VVKRLLRFIHKFTTTNNNNITKRINCKGDIDMIFSINRDVLLNNLIVIQRGLPNKTPLPILNAIKFEVNQDHLILTTSNSDLAIQVLIEDKSLKVTQVGKAAIPGKFLIEIIRKLEANTIEFAVLEERSVVIKAERSDFKLNLMDYLDYPEVDFLELRHPILLDSEIIKKLTIQLLTMKKDLF